MDLLGSNSVRAKWQRVYAKRTDRLKNVVGEKKKHLSPICGEHFGRVGVRVGCALAKSGLSSRVSC